MKIVFLLDNNEFVEVAPGDLQIRQLQPGLVALGIEVPAAINNGECRVDVNDESNSSTGFRPLIHYNVNLSIPAAVGRADRERTNRIRVQ